MKFFAVPDHVVALMNRYISELDLQSAPLLATCDKRLFEQWLGRRVASAIGGAYVYHPGKKHHLVLINLSRIDVQKPRAIEIVVAEELLHMRHWLDGDRRRHSRHGYDRIAVQVAEIVGCSIDEVRSALLPVARRPFRYRYQCPTCGRTVMRRRTGTWSCGACSSVFDRRHLMQLVEHLKPPIGKDS